METLSLIEVILFAKDMNKMVKFYRDVLDLPLTNPGKTDFSNEDRVTFETGNCLLALQSGGKGNIGMDAPKIIFQVMDIKSARFQLLEQGAAASDIRAPASGIQICDARDPEGNAFSIEERS